MMAATCPFSTVKVRPLRIFLPSPSISTCRFLISRNAINLFLCLFTVEIVSGRHAAEGQIGRTLEIAVLDAGGGPVRAGSRIIDYVHAADGRDAEITQIGGARIDKLVALGARRRGNEIARLHRQRPFTPAILPFARNDEEQ